MKNAISVTRKENYPQWYQEVITAADLAQLSPVRGCMIITPWGFALWEMIQKKLDYEIKIRDHENIYCPLFIPLSHIEKESEHIDGFAKECAVVTHCKLEKKEGKLVPASPLEEPLIVRPTSEMIIGTLFAQRIQSHRDLPVLMNQWANIVRWEMRTRMFLRTSEFLWQEGHTAHVTEKEAHEHTITMLQCYNTFCHDVLAIPVITGQKSINEKFPGAVATYTIEAIMQDNKALQMGTSHYLGQTFAKSCDIQFQDAEKNLSYVHTTSWGVTTRLIGGLIMTHGDDDGLICPPAFSPQQVVIIPFVKKDADEQAVMSYCQEIKNKLQAMTFRNEPIRVKIDTKNKKASEKKWGWVKKGVPVRVEIGHRETTEQSICYALRTEASNQKHDLALTEFCNTIPDILEQCQQTLYARAKERVTEQHCPLLETIEAVNKHFNTEQPTPALVYWRDNDPLEESLQQTHKISIRCYPDAEIFKHHIHGPCVFDAGQEGRLALIGKAY